MAEILEQIEHKLKISPITPHIGALIEGVSLSGDLESAITDQIYQALLQYKVIFFRHQNQLNDEEQERFAALLGEPVRHPTVPVAAESNYIFELDSRSGGRADVWHTDVTFIDAYPKLSILRAVVVPEVGGDTTWANTETAYEELPSSLKDLANQLRAIHTNDFDYGGYKPNADQKTLQKHKEIFVSTHYETEHSVVRIHPETGKPSLVLGQFFKRFVGLSARESSRIFDIFQERITKPENTVRWTWQAGDIAIWDNRATQHRAVNDYGDDYRLMRRVTLAGDVPQGIDGRASITLIPQGLSADELQQQKVSAVLNSN
ncbi:TauD/TfdA family dioxygenase [Acinetobacter puyangensis]|uniref:Taurine dioxygenase n=1 Tax=Acinetobacter puyangensis TaxID=1096779 RepID=A0A240EB93_9GAMM|nr:TauD/TfdA family dioxygenase [Acinetobacter puyangensis]SNX45964.1 taurine dioxygenase [Acinetobacter puyangensis]